MTEAARPPTYEPVAFRCASRLACAPTKAARSVVESSAETLSETSFEALSVAGEEHPPAADGDERDRQAEREAEAGQTCLGIGTDSFLPAVRGQLTGLTLVVRGERHLVLVRGLFEPLGTAGNLVSDAHLAALAIEHGADLCSAEADFSRFRRLRRSNPLAAG